ncbi:MAG: helicase, partial [Firmicutes bacterium]|nr:helicase [Bacillota bacterium]
DKQKMFTKVRSGEIRVLLGSTSKMGAGANAQKRLIALHHIDCPYRPSDLEQRNGRIIRQGNENPEVDIYNYVTKGTFDAFLYQLVESKQRFISQVMTSKSIA